MRFRALRITAVAMCLPAAVLAAQNVQIAERPRFEAFETSTVKPTDPAQQKMMAFMPLFMGFIFFRFSSGLNLYMCTSNLVGIGQQYYLNKTEPLPSRSKFKKSNA